MWDMCRRRIVDNDSDGDGYCDLGSGIGEEDSGCTDSLACGDLYDPIATENDGTCLFFDNCGICDGDSLCAIFIEDNIQITLDEALVSDDEAIAVFSENFEDLMETQLGLPDGSVVVLNVILNTRGDVGVTMIIRLLYLKKNWKYQVLILIYLLKKLKIK